jgi:hypothetical protein
MDDSIGKTEDAATAKVCSGIREYVGRERAI